MKIALAQIDIAWEDRLANLEKAAQMIEAAAAEKSDLIIFPEMFTSGFSMNVEKIAETPEGPSETKLKELARVNNINIIAGLSVASKVKGIGKNVALVVDRTGEKVASLNKIHPFSLTGEGNHYLAGEQPEKFFVDGVAAAVFICYDLRFPEDFRKIAKEVKIIFTIANWPSVRNEHWVALLKARAIENQCFIVGVNRVGQDGQGIDYPGLSLVFDPMGKAIVAGSKYEELIVGEIEIDLVDKVRKELPFLEDID